MPDQVPPFRNTSLILIALTLVTGMALGWLLHDIFGGPVIQPAPTSVVMSTANALRPTPAPATPLPTAALPATARPEPTAAPATPLPTAALPATARLQPTAAPAEPTLAPTVAAPTAGPAEMATPATTRIIGYAGHTVADGENLAMIAAGGGSTPALLSSYNLLDGEPQPGRALIVPRVEGQASTIESEPLLVSRGRADRPWVALTLDAGASAEPVPAMLKTLREHDIRITFFLTGKWIEDNPDLAREIAADGHEIANHTFTHPDLRNLSEAALRGELADTEALLQTTAGATTRPLFRPPYGAYDKRVLQLVVDEGYLPIYWTLDSLDSVGEPKTADFLFERITAKLTPEQLRGAILLAHCGSQPTADALPRILDRFAEMGFEVKKVSEVLSG
jgi:peptidoglycan/xylan/chitin deacetylase (PgdA/CDA1 family)